MTQSFPTRRSSDRSTTTPTDAPRESPWLYVVLALLGTAGFFYVNLAAAIVEGLMGTLGFSHAQAGTVMSANIYGASLGGLVRSEEHTSELQSLMRISYDVFCLKKKNELLKI